MSNLSPMGENDDNDNDNDNDNVNNDDNPYEDNNNDISQENPEDYGEELDATGDPVEKTTEKANEGEERFNEQSAADAELDNEETNQCKNAKTDMVIYYTLAFFPLFIIFNTLLIIITYSTGRWLFWTRSWGSGKSGIINTVLFGFILPLLYIAITIPTIIIIVKIIRTLPFNSNSIQEFPFIVLMFIVSIALGLAMLSMAFFPFMGICNVLYRFANVGMKGGAIAPITIDDFVENILKPYRDAKAAEDAADNVKELDDAFGEMGDVPLSGGAKKDLNKANIASKKAKSKQEKSENAVRKAEDNIKKALKRGTYFKVENLAALNTFFYDLFDKMKTEGINIFKDFDDVMEEIRVEDGDKFKNKGMYSFFVKDTKTKPSSPKKEGQEGGSDTIFEQLQNVQKTQQEILDNQKETPEYKKWQRDKITKTIPGFWSFCCCYIGYGFPIFTFFPRKPLANIYGLMYNSATKSATTNHSNVQFICSPCSLWNRIVQTLFIGSTLAGAVTKMSLWIAFMVVFFLLAFVSWWTWFFDCWGMFEAKEESEKDGEQKKRQDEARIQTFIQCMKDDSTCKAIEDDQDNELTNYSYEKYPKKYKEFQEKALKYVNGLTDEEIETYIEINHALNRNKSRLSEKEAKKTIYKQKRRELFDEWIKTEDHFKYSYFKTKCNKLIRKKNGIFSFDNITNFFKDMNPSGNK